MSAGRIVFADGADMETKVYSVNGQHINGQRLMKLNLGLIDRLECGPLGQIEGLHLPEARTVIVNGNSWLRAVDVPVCLYLELERSCNVTSVYGPKLAGLYLGDTRTIMRSFYVGEVTRGYHWRGGNYGAGWRVSAGCRHFTVPDALVHWSDDHRHKAQESREMLNKVLQLIADYEGVDVPGLIGREIATYFTTRNVE